MGLLAVQRYDYVKRVELVQTDQTIIILSRHLFQDLLIIIEKLLSLHLLLAYILELVVVNRVATVAANRLKLVFGKRLRVRTEQ